MIFLTAQPIERYNKLMNGNKIIPDWSKHSDLEYSYKTYQYILNDFNMMYNTNATGLIFGYNFETVEEMYLRILKYGIPSGSYFPSRPLLIFDIPDNIPFIKTDFYRFSDLIYAFGENDLELLSLAKRDLYSPNGPDGTTEYELPVTYIPLLDYQWLISINKCQPQIEGDSYEKSQLL